MRHGGSGRRINIRLEHTIYGHWGGRSGYPRFAEYLDPARFAPTWHGAQDNHEECPRWLRPFRRWLLWVLKRCRMKWYKLSDLNAEILALLDCLRGRVDVVHFLDGEHGGQFLPRLLKRIGSRTRTVVTFHQPPALLDTLLNPATLRWFDHIVLMSPSQLPFFEARGLSDRVSVIPHGIDTAFFRPDVAKVQAGPVQCITAGHWLRDWDVFAQTAARLPHVTFHIVTGRETGVEDFPNVVRHHGIGDDALAALYCGSDILFLPLHDSTANNALLEGIASGLPVVATDLVSTRRYLAGDEVVFIPAGDGDAAVSALSQLVDDAERRHVMGVRARAQAERLSWNVIARDYEALYATLVRVDTVTDAPVARQARY